MFRELDDLLQAAIRRHEPWSALEKRNDLCARKLLILNDCVAEAYRENWGRLEKRHPILFVLPMLMRRMQSDTMLVARAINAGKDKPGFSSVTGLHTGLSHAYRALARRCEIHAAGNPKTGKAVRPGREDVLNALPTLKQDALPEMHFVMALLRQDLRRATDVLMSEKNRHIKDLKELVGL